MEKLTFGIFQGRVTVPSVNSRIQLSKVLMSQTSNAKSVHMDQGPFELGGEYPMQKSSVIFSTSQPVSAMNVQKVDAMSGRYPVNQLLVRYVPVQARILELFAPYTVSKLVVPKRQ